MGLVQDLLTVEHILLELTKCEYPTAVITQVLERYIHNNPNELVDINACVTNLISVAFIAKDKRLTMATNSMQHLMSMDTVLPTPSSKNKDPHARVKCLIGAMVTLFPTGEKLMASQVEREFYDLFIEDLKAWDRSELDKWSKAERHYEYISKLLDYKTLST